MTWACTAVDASDAPANTIAPINDFLITSSHENRPRHAAGLWQSGVFMLANGWALREADAEVYQTGDKNAHRHIMLEGQGMAGRIEGGRGFSFC